MSDEPQPPKPVISEGEYVLTPAMLKMFADTAAYAKARYGNLSAAYSKPGGYAAGGLSAADGEAL